MNAELKNEEELLMSEKIKGKEFIRTLALPITLILFVIIPGNLLFWAIGWQDYQRRANLEKELALAMRTGEGKEEILKIASALKKALTLNPEMDLDERIAAFKPLAEQLQKSWTLRRVLNNEKRIEKIIKGETLGFPLKKMGYLWLVVNLGVLFCLIWAFYSIKTKDPFLVLLPWDQPWAWIIRFFCLPGIILWFLVKCILWRWKPAVNSIEDFEKEIKELEKIFYR